MNFKEATADVDHQLKEFYSSQICLGLLLAYPSLLGHFTFKPLDIVVIFLMKPICSSTNLGFPALGGATETCVKESQRNYPSLESEVNTMAED